jgi:hypothetical protein
MMLLALALAAQYPPGPAILMISGNNRQFVQFSSFARCEAARKLLEAEWAEYRRQTEAKGYKMIPGTETKARCIPG